MATPDPLAPDVNTAPGFLIPGWIFFVIGLLYCTYLHGFI